MLFGAWCSQVEDLSDCEEIMTLPIAVWPQSTNVTDRQTTDNTLAIPTHGFLAMSRQKPYVAPQRWEMDQCLLSETSFYSMALTSKNIDLAPWVGHPSNSWASCMLLSADLLTSVHWLNSVHLALESHCLHPAPNSTDDCRHGGPILVSTLL